VISERDEQVIEIWARHIGRAFPQPSPAKRARLAVLLRDWTPPGPAPEPQRHDTPAA
jgi:hypothetical protein